MNLLYWLVGGLACCLVVGWLLLRHAQQTQAALLKERAQREFERAEDERRAAREAAVREASRQRIAEQQAARADARRRVEPPAEAEKPRAPVELAPIVVARTPASREPASQPLVAPPAIPRQAAPVVVPPPAPAPAPAPVVIPPPTPAPAIAQRPAAPAIAVPPPSAKPPVPADDPAAHPVVMVADDSKVVRVKTGRILAQHPYRVCFAADGLEALQMIQASPPSLLITDVDMPGLDGFELTRRLRAEPATAGLPVIMITAADATHRAAAQQAGVDVVLGKPFSEEDLIGHVQAAVRRHMPDGKPWGAVETLPKQACET